MPHNLLKITFLSIFSLFFISFSVIAETLEKIVITGNDSIPKETIIMFSGAKIEQDISINQLNNILKNIYDSNFFENVQVNFDDKVLKIDVLEKPIIENVKYEGIKSNNVLEEISNSRILKQKSSFDEIILKKDKDIITNLLSDLGYYFAKVEANVELLSNNKINLIYNIKLGNKSKINKISFIGNKVFKDKKLKNVIISEEYKFWKFLSGKKFLNQNIIELDKRLLKNFYLNKGYYGVEINSSFARLIKKNQFELIYNINAKEKFYFDNLELELNNDFDKENFNKLSELFKNLKGQNYSIFSIKKIIEEIENIALNEQYASVKIIPVETILSNKINIKFKIEDTEKFFVEKINIFGNNVTQENVIRNQFEIDEGDPFNEILYNKTINNIKSLGFFKSTNGEITNGSNDKTKVININVEEQATGEISLGAGTGTSGATIAFGVKENNFLGKGINLNAFTSITEESVKGEFYARNPNFQNSDKAVYAGIESVEIDRSTEFGYKTNKTGFNFGTEFEYLDDLNLGLGFSNYYEKIKTDGRASALQKTQEGNYWDSFLNVDFDYDKRNQKFQASDGFRSFYSLDVPLLSDTNTLVNSYEYNHYGELFEENITNVSLLLRSANSISGDNIKLSERLFIPTKKLRGFERGKIGPKDGDDYIGGNFITTASVSSSIPQLLNNLQEVDFVMFFDAANIWGVDYDSSIDDKGKIRSSVGIGIDWITPVGPLNFTFAQPLTKEDSDKTETFRFNLGTTF